MRTKVKINSWTVGSALIIISVTSVLTIFGLTQLDQIVHGDLYYFGLVFSYRWAAPFWLYSAAVIGLAWFNIAGSIAIIYHVFGKNSQIPSLEEEQAKQSVAQEALQPETDVEVESVEEQLASEDTGIEEFIAEPLQVHVPIKDYDVTQPEDVVDSQC